MAAIWDWIVSLFLDNRLVDRFDRAVLGLLGIYSPA